MAELKKTMGWLSHGGYCIKCAIKDGWAKAEVYVVVGTLISLITVDVGINVEGCKSCNISKRGGWNKRGGWDFLEKTSTYMQ